MPDEVLAREFASVAELIRAHASMRPAHTALTHEGRCVTYSALDRWADRVAAALQRDQVGPGATVAVAASTTLDYVAIFLGSLRAGVAVAPLPTSSTPQTLAAMIVDAGARILFLDRATADALAAAEQAAALPVVLIDDSGSRGLQNWMAAADSIPAAVNPQPHWPFNVIYSSGTTGVPKGIVQPHSFRWSNVQRARLTGYGPDSVTLLATPLYSNATLATLFGALALGGSVVLMEKFTARTYLALAQESRATHTVLVPVQYLRLLAA
jgi:long-chain acyl-CoA synthetase